MRYSSIVFLFAFLLLSYPPAFAQGRLTPRPLDPLAADTYANAVERSTIVRSLVETLESSNVIVHIVTTRDLPAGIGGTTRFVTSRGGYRYLRISLSSELSLRLRSAILGHELKHACEIAVSPATDVDSLRELFEHEGRREGDFFETPAAIEIERGIRMELTATRSLRLLSGQARQTESVVKFDH